MPVIGALNLLSLCSSSQQGDGCPQVREALSKGSALYRLWCAYGVGY